MPKQFTQHEIQQKIEQFETDPELFITECGIEVDKHIPFLKVVISIKPELIKHIINEDGTLRIDEELLYIGKNENSEILATECIITGNKLTVGQSLLYRTSGDSGSYIGAIANLDSLENLNNICPFTRKPITEFLLLDDLTTNELEQIVTNNQLQTDQKTLNDFFEESKEKSFPISNLRLQMYVGMMKNAATWSIFTTNEITKTILLKILPHYPRLKTNFLDTLLEAAYACSLSGANGENLEIYGIQTLLPHYKPEHLFSSRVRGEHHLPSAFFLLAVGDENSHASLDVIFSARTDLIGHIESDLLFQQTLSVLPTEAEAITAFFGLSQTATGRKVLQLIQQHKPDIFNQCSLETLTQQFKLHIELDIRVCAVLCLLSDKNGAELLIALFNNNSELTHKFQQYVAMLIKNQNPETALSINALVTFLWENPTTKPMMHTIIESHNVDVTQAPTTEHVQRQSIETIVHQFMASTDLIAKLMSTAQYHLVLRMLLQLSPACFNYLPKIDNIFEIQPALGCTYFFILCNTQDGARVLNLMLQHDYLTIPHLTPELFTTPILILANPFMNRATNFSLLILFQQGIDFIRGCCDKNPKLSASLNFSHVISPANLCDNETGSKLMLEIINNNKNALNGVEPRILFSIMTQSASLGYKIPKACAFISICIDAQSHPILKVWIERDPDAVNIMAEMIFNISTTDPAIIPPLGSLNSTEDGKDVLRSLARAHMELGKIIETHFNQTSALVPQHHFLANQAEVPEAEDASEEQIVDSSIAPSGGS